MFNNRLFLILLGFLAGVWLSAPAKALVGKS